MIAIFGGTYKTINSMLNCFTLGLSNYVSLKSQPFPQKSHECALKLTDLWITNLLFDLNY